MLENNQKIPEGWSVKKLGSFITFKNGLNAEKESYGTGIKFVNTMDIFNNKRLYEKNIIGSVNVKEKNSNENDVIYGDILFNRTSEIPEEIAFSSVYLDEKKVTFGGFIIRGRPQSNIIHPQYSIYCFQSNSFRKDAIRRCQGAIRSNIGQNDLSKISILIPPLPEQEKIAKILGTWDEAIEKLSSLIEQKKLFKKGLMQKLLTGKVRLFKTSPLAGEVADLSAGEGLNNNDNIKISSHRMYQPYIKEFSRDMRKNSTKAENLLWQKIRNGQLGFKFRRQHQIDNKYIADFICLEKRLIIELDGGQHNDRPKDKDRTLYLENNNFKVIRFWDNEILQNIDGCLEILLKEISLLNNPSPCPSPARGEGISATYSNSLPQGAMMDVEYSLDTPHLAQKCHPLPQGARKEERFSQPWKEVKLGSVLEVVSRRNKNLSITRVLSVTNSRGFILPEEQFSRVVASKDLSNYKVVKNGEFAYNPSRLNVGSIDQLTNFTDGLLSPMYVIFKCNEKLLSNYMKHWITTAEFNTKVRNSAQGSVRETVDFKTLSSIKINLPSDISEQQAIANVLSTADDEIDLLNKKLILFKEQKKGLMQQLLTGNIRVKVN